MGRLLIGQRFGFRASVEIEVSDGVLDRVAKLLEHPPTEGGGFWIAGHFEVEVDGVATYADPARGHQRLWVSTAQLVSLCYDRPLSVEPDRLPDEPHVIVL